MFRPWFLALLWIGLTNSLVFADSFTVTILALDEDKKPVPKADVSLFWQVEKGVMTPYNPKALATDKDGKAVLVVDNWSEKRPVLVLTSDRKLGGLVNVSKENENKELTVTLGPLVRMKAKFSCKDLNAAPTWINTMISLDGIRAPFSQQISEAAEFDFLLPIGKYKFHTYGNDVESVKQSATLDMNRSEFDLGTIDIKANPIAKLKGKECPNWIITAAQGVKPEVKLSDYKGKWVYIDFWGFWCGPCVASSLPDLISLYEAHADHRDKFEIIAIHNNSVKSFEELEPKLTKIKERYWQGKDLPFPSLLDGDGKTEAMFKLDHFPTGLLIDPDGKLVGEVSIKDLEEKLPPLSAAKQWARTRDLSKNIYWSFEPTNYTPKKFAEIFKLWIRCDVELDLDALKASGLQLDSPLPGIVFGIPITLRTIEDLMLAPHGLGISPSPDGKKLLITKRVETKEPPSYFQNYNAKALNDRLDRSSPVISQDPPMAEALKSPLEIKDQPLLEALKRIGNDFNLPFALDAKALQAKTIDPTIKVSGTIAPLALRKSLAKLLEPSGLTVEVQGEVLMVKAK